MESVMQHFSIRMIDPDDARITEWGETEVKTYYAEIDVDESLLPDDEWRSVFYPMYTLQEVAEHIIWNRVIRQFREVEGYADKDEGVHWKITNVRYEWEEYDGEERV